MVINGACFWVPNMAFKPGTASYKSTLATLYLKLAFTLTISRVAFFLTRKHILVDEYKYNIKSGGYDLYTLRHAAHLFIGGE